MAKAATSELTTLQATLNAFSGHALIRVKKTNGELLGPGYIAIMYGQVAFRIYPKDIARGSHFIRMEEVSEILFEPELS